MGTKRARDGRDGGRRRQLGPGSCGKINDLARPNACRRYGPCPGTVELDGAGNCRGSAQGIEVTDLGDGGQSSGLDERHH